MAKKLGTAFRMITGEALPKTAGGNNPVGVLLTDTQKKDLDRIASEVGTTRHKLMIYALADFIKRYDAGEKPRLKNETKTTLDI